MEEEKNSLYELFARICNGDMTYFYLMLCHGVNSDNFHLLSYQDLKEIGIDQVGTRRTIFSEIESLRLELEQTDTKRLDNSEKQKKEVSESLPWPIRPPTAFQLFLQELRVNQPGNFAAVNQDHCRRWMSMSIKEKTPFVTMAKKLWEEYETDMEAFNLQLLHLTGDEEFPNVSKDYIEFDDSKWDVVNEDEFRKDVVEAEDESGGITVRRDGDGERTSY